MSDALLLAVDPGLRGSGIALFKGTELEAAAYVAGSAKGERAEAWVPMVEAVRKFLGAREVGQLVIEMPQAYVVSRTKGDQNDLIQLAAVVGGLCFAFRGAHQRVYLPAEWKGQVPKTVMHDRLATRLSHAELDRINCQKRRLLHNVLDAVGLGLTFLRRL